MIQRIQTVYLGVGAVLLALTPFVGRLPEAPGAGHSWYVPVVGSGLALAVIASLVAVALFGHRKRQRTVVVIAQLLTLAVLISVFVGRRSSELPLSVDTMAVSEWLLVILPVVSYILFLLARRAIDRDIRLVESVDRLR